MRLDTSPPEGIRGCAPTIRSSDRGVWTRIRAWTTSVLDPTCRAGLLSRSYEKARPGRCPPALRRTGPGPGAAPARPLARGARRPARHVPVPRAQREGSDARARRDVARRHATRRTGRLDADHRGAPARHLRLHLRGGRRVADRPEQLADEAEPGLAVERRPRTGDLGAVGGRRGSSRHAEPPLLPVGCRRRRPRLLRLHAPGLRPRRGHALPGPVPAARLQRRRRRLVRRWAAHT